MLLDRSGFYAATSCSDKSLALYDFDIGECVAGMVGHSGELRLGGSSFIRTAVVAITGYNNFTGYNGSGYMFQDITGYNVSGILSYGVKVFCQSLKFSASLVRCENVLRS